jgi:hypothetical protein
MYERRLAMLAYQIDEPIDPDKWFDPEKMPYRATLLRLQMAILSVPSIALSLTGSDEDFVEIRQNIPEQYRDQYTQFHSHVRDIRDEIAGEIVGWSQEVGVTYGNPYWHTRGLCAATMIATAAETDPVWTSSVRDVAKQSADNIGRPDWGQKIDSFLDDNIGLWLVGY